MPNGPTIDSHLDSFGILWIVVLENELSLDAFLGTELRAADCRSVGTKRERRARCGLTTNCWSHFLKPATDFASAILLLFSNLTKE